MEIRRTKNLETRIVFPIQKNDGTLITSAADLDSELDAWADGSNPDGFADCTNEATEIGATGIYYLTLTAGEMNADYIAVQVKSSTSGALVQTILINTTLQRADAIAISGDTDAANNCELMFDGTGYAGGTTKLDVNVASQANIDFGALQKASIGTAVETQLTAANTELAATPTTISGLRAMLQFLFQYFRNARAETSGLETLYKEDAATALSTRTLGDDGTTFTRGEMNDA